MISRLHN